jgi:AcrR family transcriptional regulator
MEDKRVYKTQKHLRDTLIALLEEKPFEKITVKELCEYAHTGRATFYTYYDDKYSLLEDVFHQIGLELQERYRLRAEHSPSPAADTPSAALRHDFHILLSALLDVHDHFRIIFDRSHLPNNLDLIFAYQRFVIRHVREIEDRYADTIILKYPVDLTNSFLSFGMWGFISRGYKSCQNRQELEALAAHILDNLLEKNILFSRKS